MHSGLTSLQEGDIIRLLRRVLDLLRQIPRLPYVPGTRGVDAQLRLNARRALTIMDRFASRPRSNVLVFRAS